MISLTSLNFSWTGNNNTDIVELLYQIYPWWIEDEKKSDDDLRTANKVCFFFFCIQMLLTQLCSVCENSSRCTIMTCALLKMRFCVESFQCNVWNSINGSHYYFHYYDTIKIMSRIPVVHAVHTGHLRIL